MKRFKLKIKLSSILYTLIIIILFLLLSCNTSQKQNYKQLNYKDQAAYDPRKDVEIQKYNIELKKKQTKVRFPCDTISVMEYVLNNFPSGSYLLEFDRTTTYNIPKPAVIYYNDLNQRYVFAVVAFSRPGERLIEPSNIIGYDQSNIDLDSTKLGTPFIYLILFECNGDQLSKIWEAPVPSHGGFNTFALRRWRYNQIPYIEVRFHYAQGVGHINYNYFLINDIRKDPLLLMTYEGTNFKRTLANINNDLYPDYYEHIFYNLDNKVYSKDSVAFIYNSKDSLFVNTRNQKQTRPY